MKTIQTLISESSTIYSSELSYNIDGLNNGNSYMINLDVETQNPQGGKGMTVSSSQVFNVNYPILRVLNKPVITQLLDKSAVQIDWAGLKINPGIISGKSDYVDDFMILGNTALELPIGSTLTYNSSVIPASFNLPFMCKMEATFNGIIFSTTDNSYEFGYELSTQRFYTKIDNITTYSSLIKITINPFYFTILPSHVVIRQYNMLNQVKDMCDLNVSDICDYPVSFMIQDNN